MRNIGHFVALPNGTFVGDIVTLSVQARNVLIAPSDDEDSGPHFRVTIDDVEIGVGWRGSASDRYFAKLDLDDPSFTGPIEAELIWKPGGTVARLTWQRPS